MNKRRKNGWSNTHTVTGYAKTRQVFLDGKWLDPAPSQKYHNHSPDGFNWGYEGSGPAQLALALVLAITGKPDGYQFFKRDTIAQLPQGENFKISFAFGESFGNNS